MSAETDASAPLVVAAMVARTERDAVMAAMRQLAESTGAAGQAVRIRLNFFPSLAAVDVRSPRSILIASFLSDAFRDEAWPQPERRWRAEIAPLTPSAGRVFLCTIFRHIAAPPRQPLLERIRRLNLLATELSHDFGFNVIDIDGTLAHFGARELRTDCRLGGGVAAEVAGYAIVDAILASVPDDLIPAPIADGARQFQGPLHGVPRLVVRRLGSGKTQAAHGRA